MTACIARTTVRPEGDAPAWGTVDVEWYDDRVTVTVRSVGRACVTEEYANGEDVVVEIRTPTLDELLETLPGAD